MIDFLACGLVGLSFLFSLGAVRQLLELPAHERLVKIDLFTWIAAGLGELRSGGLAPFVLSWGFQLDPLSSVMILVVTGIGFLIHIYSTGYMAHEGGYYRFFAYLNLFMFSMLTLVLANNFVLMFVGWEGVGLCSYLLIGFYFHKKSAADAGKKAFIVNRVGDFGFMLGMFLDFHYFWISRLSQPSLQRPKQSQSGHVGDWGSCSDSHLHPAVYRGDGQVGPGAALRVVAGCHGRSDPGQCLDSRGDDGDGRSLHGGPLQCLVCAGSDGHANWSRWWER